LTPQPTYLVCVGATKSGTSWLYRHLAKHPDCHFRTIKELHYFDMRRPEHFEAALRRVDAHLAEMDARVAAAPADGLATLVLKRADLREWRGVVAKGEMDLDAYRGFVLGGLAGEKLVGDVTPAYAMLALPRLKRIAAISPDLKILFLMRDPVARTWSHIRMVAARSGAAFESVARDLLARMTSGDLSGEGQGIHDRGDYLGIIPRLKAAFAPAVLRLEFTEDMLTEVGLARLWAWLGIGPGPVALETKVYESPKLAMTGAEAVSLRRWLQPQYDFVSGLMPALPQAWASNMEKGLA
jgi:Sulfotransferase family